MMPVSVKIMQQALRDVRKLPTKKPDPTNLFLVCFAEFIRDAITGPDERNNARDVMCPKLAAPATKNLVGVVGPGSSDVTIQVFTFYKHYNTLSLFFIIVFFFCLFRNIFKGLCINNFILQFLFLFLDNKKFDF